MEMETGLLLKEKAEENKEAKGHSAVKLTWAVLVEEVKRLGYIAGPMMAVTSSVYLFQVISVMMAGHLDELSLSSTAIAVSLYGATGFSVMQGMASALETLCGQAYGAHQYQKIGTLTYTAIFCLIVVAFPISILWINVGSILVLVGLDHMISEKAGRFIVWLIPSLFAHAALQPLVRYFQMQSLILPLIISTCASFCVHVPLCWILVFKSELDYIGAALAMDISMWLNAILLGVYMAYSNSCVKTRAPISMKIFGGIVEFFRLAVPSAVMICLEWWSFELLVLLSGLLPNPALETSVLSVCLNTIATLYQIPFGLGAGVSTRVSNELGAENPVAARIAVYAAILLALTEAVILIGVLFAFRHVFGFVFSNVEEVVDYVTEMTPLICLSMLADSLQGVLSGVARGCGWQHLGAYVNLAAFYLFGIPLAAILAFWVGLRGKGLWIGIQAGAILQTVLLAIITICTDWEKQVIKTRERLYQERSMAADTRLM